jgi:hypothetical protein
MTNTAEGQKQDWTVKILEGKGNANILIDIGNPSNRCSHTTRRCEDTELETGLQYINQYQNSLSHDGFARESWEDAD